MSGQLIEVVVNSGALVEYVNALDKNEKKVMRMAYKKALNPIAKMAKAGARKATKSRTLAKGVRMTAWKSGLGASIYIRSPRDPYYKLLFFEGGAKGYIGLSRQRKGARRGSITAKWFFKSAVEKYLNAVPKLLLGVFSAENDKAATAANKAASTNTSSWASNYAQAKGRS